jgi:hypothetical protein
MDRTYRSKRSSLRAALGDDDRLRTLSRTNSSSSSSGSAGDGGGGTGRPVSSHHNGVESGPAVVPKLRTASRKAKTPSKTAARNAIPHEVQVARASHNLVEKKYRSRLNGQFERLIAVLPSRGGSLDDMDGGGGGGLLGDDDDDDARRLSKGEVLDLARQRIKALEKENKLLARERDQLVADVDRMQRMMAGGP